MLCDDHPGHPMAGVIRLRFAGFLNAGHFEAALTSVAKRHPLLYATVKKRRFGTPEWRHNHETPPVVQWDATPSANGFTPVCFTDLSLESATRFQVVNREDGHDLLVQAHHACTDAQGLISLMEDLMIEYARLTGGAGSDGSARTPDQARLLRRGAPRLTCRGFMKMLHKQAVGLRGVLQFIRNAPVPLAVRGEDESVTGCPASFPNPIMFELSRTETRSLFAAGRKGRVNAGDLLMRDLFLAISGWRQERAMGSGADCFRVSVPMSLRGATDQRMPMANSFSLVFLDRGHTDIKAPDLLLRSIHEEMQLIKENQLQYTFLLSLAIARRLPGGLPRFLAKDTCRATSCFSNIGAVFAMTPLPRHDGKLVVGGLRLESVDFVIPLRQRMHAAFCAHIYGGRLRILMNYDPRHITQEDARDLLEGFRRRVYRSMDEGSA